ncbi:MAG: hypothetical protein R3F11_21940 [Verrucomicrobiales bacterium]
MGAASSSTGIAKLKPILTQFKLAWIASAIRAEKAETQPETAVRGWNGKAG